LLEFRSTDYTRDLHKDGARLALVDVQPPYFEQPSAVDLVVDHHPKRINFKRASPILAVVTARRRRSLPNILRAAAMEPSQRWRRAALWHQDRYVVSRSAAAICRLERVQLSYPIANKAMITASSGRRCRAKISKRWARAHRLQSTGGVAVIHLGEVNREDVIPQMAEFCLQIEGADWSVVSGW
jgi:hypothetical protein